MKALARILRSNIDRRALRDGGGIWAAVAVVWYGARLLSRLGARHDEVVHRQVLNPGQAITVTHSTTTRRQAAKDDKVAAKQAAAATKQAKRDARSAKRQARRAAA